MSSGYLRILEENEKGCVGGYGGRKEKWEMLQLHCNLKRNGEKRILRVSRRVARTCTKKKYSELRNISYPQQRMQSLSKLKGKEKYILQHTQTSIHSAVK